MKKSNRRQWALFRFQVVGQLLAAPPRVRGELRQEIDKLAERSWSHPITKVPLTVLPCNTPVIVADPRGIPHVSFARPNLIV